ncbi:MAG: hypothetical protein JNK19_14110 [Tabrizicola sp.]|nr:hypothetical protein [Tabrizicola sp.]
MKTIRKPARTRRNFLASASAVVAMPAIIVRASVASDETSFAGEDLIVVSCSGNYELGSGPIDPHETSRPA